MPVGLFSSKRAGELNQRIVTLFTARLGLDTLEALAYHAEVPHLQVEVH